MANTILNSIFSNVNKVVLVQMMIIVFKTLSLLFNFFFLHLREEKTEQLLDCKQELEQMEIELKRLQQEVCTWNFHYI